MESVKDIHPDLVGISINVMQVTSVNTKAQDGYQGLFRRVGLWKNVSKCLWKGYRKR